MSQRCIVTGGAGVIGSTLVEHLVARGDRVRVIDVLAPPESLPPEVDYVQGDLVDVGAAAIEAFDPDTIFHLAATFERSEEVPEFWAENAHHNVAASAAVLAGAVASPSLQRYVFASSYLIYDPELYLFPEPQSVPCRLAETDRIDPRNACGAAKLLHEKEIELASLADDAEFTTVSARIYRVYGRSSRDVVSRWIRAALRGESLSVYGAESRFDYVFADDVADGLIRLADSGATGVVNLATGRSRTVDEVLACLSTHFSDLDTGIHVPADTYEASEANTARLERATGWTPPTQLEHGIARLVEHERKLSTSGTTSVRVREPIEAGVLISSVGSKTHIVEAVRAAQHALNMSGAIWGGDADPLAPARRVTDEFWQMPVLAELDPGELIGVCKAAGIRLIIPTRDGELQYYARHAEQLGAADIFVPIGGERSIAVTDDKLEFAQALAAAGLPSIPTATTPNDLHDMVGAERFVVKQRSGAGSANLHIDITSERVDELMSGRSALVVQPLISGAEYSVDSYVDRHGTCVGAVVRERVKVTHGESQITTIVDEPSLRDLAVRVVETLGVRGHSVTQVITSSDGPYVVECNSRVGGASSAAWAAGLRTVDHMLIEAVGETPVPAPLATSPITQTRIASDLISWR